jgi:SAM-dependent methyltransferase
VLDVGCGVSDIFHDMMQDGFTGKLIGVDNVPLVVERCQEKYVQSPNVSFMVADIRKLTEHFSSESIDIVLDKATSDGVLCSKASAITTPQIYLGVGALLKPGGVFVICSVNEPSHGWFTDYVLPSLTEAAPTHRWRVEAHTVLGEDGENDCPYVYVITKLARPILSRAARAVMLLLTYYYKTTNICRC